MSGRLSSNIWSASTAYKREMPESICLPTEPACGGFLVHARQCGLLLDRPDLNTIQLVSLYVARQRDSDDPFIQSLPRDLSSFPLLSQPSLESLPAFVCGPVADVQKRFTQDWHAVDSHNDDEIIDFDAFRWAWLCVNSRCVWLDLDYEAHEENFTLVPLLDMANHSSTCANATVKYDHAHFELKLTRPVKRGEEIVFEYGGHDQATLWAEYGFIESSNPHERIDLTARVMSLLDKKQASVKVLRQHHYLGDYTLDWVDGTIAPSWRLLVALRLLCATEQHDAWLSMIAGERDDISTDNDQRVGDLLANLAQAEQAQMQEDHAKASLPVVREMIRGRLAMLDAFLGAV
ncbi:uncharacterized protein L969DRAFT_97486 [Mixia osmundae IAM 14324]|uniref:SET domain-containing protein n=1 Tax=Mixia osmundae (strain CBS 9802 / IAM 14324 / JCM 22182 / KY 12970) TaxID=764103 RepID=G7E4D9_MIXOS|nr:uncharacterized protein L969DRAFT_97486 [Mixia osmundae IAM 14324]KEI36285.1 hypothetical protein L969DRAFT_97486 [Mixia osmundae IAM 14324]GAA97699.1 hypothetical protein E5Q_04377 [Mixia osmundae IAM 14324]